MSVLTLTEAKTHLNVTVDSYDAELASFIDRAESAIASRVGPLAATTKTQRVRGMDTVLRLSHPPVISLTTVTSVDGTTIPTTQLTVMGGRVEYTQWGFFPSRFYDVVYQSGRATVPEDLRLACLELTRHMWETQRGGAKRPSRGGGESYSNTIPGAADAFPFRVEQLIAPYQHLGFA